MARSPTKKRLWAVFKATILGSALADSPIVLLNVLDYFGVARHGTDPGYGLLYSIAIILSIPAAMFSDEHGLANPYGCKWCDWSDNFCSRRRFLAVRYQGRFTKKAGDTMTWSNETLDRMTRSAISRVFQCERSWRAPRHRSAR